MNPLTVTLLLVLVCIIQCNGLYYWRVYNKTIPSDAYSPGQDSSQRKVYIGQGLLLEESPGLYTTTIHIDKDVHIPMDGVRLTKYYAQILCCTDQGNFEWLPTNSTDLHLLNTKNEIVSGGLEFHNRPLGIGRIRIQGGIAIGKVLLDYSGVEDNMFFVNNGNEESSGSYELLTYKNYLKPKGNETYPYI